MKKTTDGAKGRKKGAQVAVPQAIPTGDLIKEMLAAIYEAESKGTDIHNNDVRHRFVVIGRKFEEPNVTATSHLGDQGGGDPGKQGLGLPKDALFENGVAGVKGDLPSGKYGAIEFPHLRCAYEWLLTRAGEKFLAKYDQVFVQATFP